MKKKMRLTLVAGVLVCVALWGYACHKQETGTDPPSDYVGPPNVSPPALNIAASCGSGVQTEQVDLATWLVAADTFFLGVVQDVLPAQDYGVASVKPYGDDEFPTVLPKEKCQSIESAFFITVQPIYRRGPQAPQSGLFQIGMEIGDRQIRFGAGPCWAFGNSCPRTDGDEVVWPQDTTGKIVPGMIVGGALYYVEEYDFFHFLTSGSQPFLYVDSFGSVHFQEVQTHCSRYLPPIDQVTGMPLERFVEEVESVEQSIESADRSENPMRVHWRLDEPLGEEDDYVNLAWFGSCLPIGVDPDGGAPEICYDDSCCSNPEEVCIEGLCTKP